jgi:hypothetical protein
MAHPRAKEATSRGLSKVPNRGVQANGGTGAGGELNWEDRPGGADSPTRKDFTTKAQRSHKESRRREIQDSVAFFEALCVIFVPLW